MSWPRDRRGRALGVVLALLVAGGCDGPPARLAAVSDTVVVNSRRPVQLAVHVLDADGRMLPDTGIRYRSASGEPVSVSAAGEVTCSQPGDGTVRAELGSLATELLVRCRPVEKVHATWMLNLVVGDPARELPFEAVGIDGRPVTLLAGQVTVEDSTVVALEGHRIRARAPGVSSLVVRVGDRESYTSVHVYEPRPTPEGIRPGEKVAVRVRVAGGDVRSWRLGAARELYFIALLPDGDGLPTPGLAIVGANCSPWGQPQSYFCVAQREASVFVYHPRGADATQELSGTLAVWRQAKP